MPKTLPARLVFWASLTLGLLWRARVVFTDDGIVWPDEIYQSFEPAHRLVFGHGLVAWEFIEGARTWAVPGFVALWLELCALVGADSPHVYVRVVKLVFALLSGGAAWGSYRLARAFGARELEAALATALWSLCAVALYFSPRAMSENLAAPLLVWGLALTLARDASRRALVLGGSLLGLATLARLQVALPVAVAVLALAVRAVRERGGATRALRDVALTLAAWALAYGALDAATWHGAPGAKWGGWFHSAVVYWRFNIVEGRASGWGTAPWHYYFVHLSRVMPGVTLALGLGLLLSARRAPAVVAVVLAFLALHLGVAHKELRFLLPILPVAAALVAVALGHLPERPARGGVAVVLGLALWSLLRAPQLTMGDVGSYPERPEASAWDDFGPVNRLLLAASRQPDVCGLRVDAAHLAWTGGSTYLHVKAPLYMPGTPQRGQWNYALTRPGSGAEVVAREGGLELVRLPGVACTPDPSYAWRLP